MLVALVSLKGSPGLTTFSLALASCWPGGSAVVLECDPAGGDLADWYGMPGAPGMVGLAAAARHGITSELVGEQTQRLPRGLRLSVLVGPPGRAQATAAVAALAGQDTGSWRALAGSRAVIADCGRWNPDAPTAGVLRAASVVLVLARPSVADVARLHVLLPATQAWSHRCGLLLRDEPGYPADEVAAVLGVPVMATVPTDPRAAAMLAGQTVPSWGWSRLPLLRAARRIAGVITRDGTLHTTPDTAPARAVGGAVGGP